MKLSSHPYILPLVLAVLACAPEASSDVRPGFPRQARTPVEHARLDAETPVVGGTLPDVMRLLDASAVEAGQLIESRKTAGLEKLAATIRGNSAALARLAREIPAVDADVLARIARRVKSLDAATLRLERAAGGDTEVARRAQAEIVATLAALRQFLPGEQGTYGCPACPGVTAGSASKCPKCGTDLVKTVTRPEGS